jgi:hypothetical protein
MKLRGMQAHRPSRTSVLLLSAAGQPDTAVTFDDVETPMARIAPTMLRVLFAAALTTAAGVASALTYQQLADCMAKGIAPAQCSGNAVTPLPGSGTAPNSVLQATGAPRRRAR